MEKVFLLCLISIYARLAIGARDPNLCIRDIRVTYMATERTPLEHYIDYIDILKELDVKGEVKEVVGFRIKKCKKKVCAVNDLILQIKTRLESREVCCEGYEPSVLDDKVCQPVRDATTLGTSKMEEGALVSIGSPLKTIGLPTFCVFYIIFWKLI